MISKFPKIIAVVVFALVCLTWLFHGQTGSSYYESHAQIQHLAERPQKPIAAAPQPDRGTGKVHYADTPEPVNEDEPTSTSSFVPAPTTKPIFQRKTPYAYVFYATSDEYACSALINIQRLKGFHTPHRIYALVTSNVAREYTERMEEYNVTVSVTPPPAHPHPRHSPKEKSLLKLLAFKMHHIAQDLRRVIVLDADQYVYHPLDSLFELPSVDLAAPRAYWKGNFQISTTLMVISLSDRVWQMVEQGMSKLKENWYDAELVQDLFEETVMMLPGQYAMIDQHFVDWDMPKWYRPEGDLHAEGSIVEYSKAQIGDLWTALEANAKQPVEDIKQVMVRPELVKLKKRDPPKFEEDIKDEDLGEVLTPEQVQKEKEAADKQEAKSQEEEHKHHEILEPPKTPGVPAQSSQDPLAPPPAEINGADQSVEQQEAERRKQAAAAAEAEKQRQEAEGKRQALEAQRQEAEAQARLQGQQLTAAKPGHPKALANPAAPPKPAASQPAPLPYTPQTHPNRGHLGVLHSQAVVYHFGAIYKPWQRDYDAFKKERPNVFPGMYESMRHWREASQEACPRQKKPFGGERKGPNGETWEWFHFVHNV